MMEFILSRTSACICAAVILVLLSAPVMDHFDDGTDAGRERNCDAIGVALDRFMSGSADESVLSLGTYMPGADARMSFEGRILRMDYAGGSYTYILRNEVVCGCTLTPNDVIVLTKIGDRLSVTVAG
ncbi:MAG: hypothetical protein ACI4Q9_05295 [Candidatus Methanomethylophilaceae archaeon]